MTAVTALTTARRFVPPRRWPATRLLILELRRSPWPWMLPLLALLFYFDAYRAAAGYPPIWGVRASVIGNHLVPDLVPFAAGICAWTGSREARNNATDLLSVTVRGVWARRGAMLAAGYGWLLTTYAIFVTILYSVTATHATWGGPPLWPVVVGAIELAAACAVGFALGTYLPSRFTAPLVAVGAFLVAIAAYRVALNATGGYPLLSPATSTPTIDTGVFYRIPDLSIVHLLFFGGITLIAVATLPLPATSRTIGITCAATIAVGLASSGVAVGFAGTARMVAHGVIVPALHDSASDHQVPYTPTCSMAGQTQICVHPAFKSYLHDVTDALAPVLAELAGLPGVPTQVEQIPTSQTTPGPMMGSLASIGDDPSSFALPLPQPGGGLDTTGFLDEIRTDFVTTYIAGTGAYAVTTGTSTQQAVETGLLEVAGVHRPSDAPPLPQDVSAAANRFAALTVSARHHWLSVHMTALRAGTLTLAQVP